MESMTKVIYNFQMNKELLDLNQRYWNHRRNIGLSYLKTLTQVVTPSHSVVCR